VTVVGIDVGGSKIAAGSVVVATGEVLTERRVPTSPSRGGEAILETCVALAAEVAPSGAEAVGIGLCEFVDTTGTPTSAATVDWLGLDVTAAFPAGRVTIESDVRAAALAEAHFGAGAQFASFVYLVVGTGISHCLVLDGRPYAGARGNAIVVGAPPVERIASGRALARHASVTLAEEALGDDKHAAVVERAAAELGSALAALVNALDPDAVVVGGGLGLDTRYRGLVVASARAAIEHEATRDLPIVPAALAARSGIVGAALAAIAR
jgi:glucokinase